MRSETPYTYIISGDSTRDSVSTPSIPYYTKQLGKINFTVFNNAFSGQSAGNWKDNVGGSTIQQAIDATSGDGSTTILEFSFGINRQNSGTPAQEKPLIIEGINAYLSAKPNAKIIFVSPCFSTNNGMESVYNDLKDLYPEHDHVSGIEATTDVYGDTLYYADQTHPNENGSKRLTNYIFHNVLPAECAIRMTLDNEPTLENVNNNLLAVVESGFGIQKQVKPLKTLRGGDCKLFLLSQTSHSK